LLITSFSSKSQTILILYVYLADHHPHT